MALIPCPDCDRQVSEHAPACPNCGCPINTGSASSDCQPQIPPTDTLKGALINCVVCGKEISDTANTCVSCGAPVVRTSIMYAPTEAHIKLAKEKDRFASEKYGIVLIVIGFLLCLTGLGMIIGVPFIIVGLWYFLFKRGKAGNLGMGDCPNCKTPMSFDRSLSSVSCPTCHKLILISGYTMTINN